MKKFKDYMTENAGDLFVAVKNGQVQLRSTKTPGALHTFGRNVAFAVIQGDSIVVTTKDGVTQIYKLNAAGRSVSGPVSSI